MEVTEAAPAQPAPDSWDVVALGECFDFRNGVNAEKSAYGKGIPFINVLEVITRSHITSSDIPGRVTLPPALCSDFEVAPGDIVFNRTSETQEEVGLGSVYIGTEPVVFGGFVIRGRPRGMHFDPLFIGYALRALGVRNQIIQMGQGGIRANVGQADLSRVSLPRPPLDEQRAIAAILQDIDALEAALRGLVAKKTRIMAGAARDLLSGSLRLPGFDGDWGARRLDEVSDVDPENLGSSTPATYRFRYISLEDVQHGALRGHTPHMFRTAPSRARRRLRKNDVLLGTVRPNLKSHLLFSEADEDWVCSTGFAVIRANATEADPKFIFQQILGDDVSRQIDALLTGSNYPAISSLDVRALRILMPPLPEQQAIATVLQDMDAEIRALEMRLVKTSRLREGVAAALLSGEVRVPQPTPDRQRQGVVA